MERAMDKPIVFCDIDGCVADFVKGYRQAFNRDAYADDQFTIKQFVMQVPDFFRNLPVIEKGRELVDLLSDNYRVVFLSTPMDELPGCRRDKLEWVKEKFGPGFDVLFSHSKADYVLDEKSILIDDYDRNLKEWAENGGTAINCRTRNDEIIEKISDVFNPKEKTEIKNKLKKMILNLEPTEKEKKSGNYKKGDIEVKGLKVKIENIPGSIRWGFDEENKKWISKIYDYY